MNEQPQDCVQVALVEQTALVRVIGRGSFKTGAALKQFSQSAVERGCTRFVVDMEACIGMDSTFMGVLAGIAMKLRKLNGGVVAMNLTPKTRGLLETLGLDQMIQIHDSGAAVEGALRQYLGDIAGLSSLDADTASKRLTLETMLEAHRTLVSVSPDNLPKFRSVIEYVSQDLKQLEDT